VTAPFHPGKYIPELDMVQEGVAWFKQKSFVPAQVQVEIDPPLIPATQAKNDSSPRMEMYGVERDKVVEALTSGGAKILDIAANESAGPEWISFQCSATKP
jgi:hypothetical protein